MEPGQHYQWKGLCQSGDDLENSSMWEQAGSKRTKLCSALANYAPDMDEILVTENLSQDQNTLIPSEETEQRRTETAEPTSDNKYSSWSSDEAEGCTVVFCEWQL